MTQMVSLGEHWAVCAWAQGEQEAFTPSVLAHSMTPPHSRPLSSLSDGFNHCPDPPASQAGARKQTVSWRLELSSLRLAGGLHQGPT